MHRNEKIQINIAPSDKWNWFYQQMYVNNAWRNNGCWNILNVSSDWREMCSEYMTGMANRSRKVALSFSSCYLAKNTLFNWLKIIIQIKNRRMCSINLNGSPILSIKFFCLLMYLILVLKYCQINRRFCKSIRYPTKYE